MAWESTQLESKAPLTLQLHGQGTCSSMLAMSALHGINNSLELCRVGRVNAVSQGQLVVVQQVQKHLCVVGRAQHKALSSQAAGDNQLVRA
jgi:hypothetical protein